MYTITIPIPVFSANEKHVSIPTGLARDILTQLKYEPELRLICMRAVDIKNMTDPYDIALEEYPGLSFRILPWRGGLRSWLLQYAAIRATLIEEARNASVWHTTCSRNLWDLTTLSYEVGHRYVKGMQVFCLDSDPAAMLEKSGGWSALKAGLVRSRLNRRVAEADATIFVGSGVEQRYGYLARRSVLTKAVWLQDGDVANEEQVKRKFQQSSSEPIRIVVPTRLEAWKGVDDAIQALTALGDQIPPWTLDVMGEGSQKKRLVSLARNHAQQIRFLTPVPYGSQFFEQLRSYHIVLVPTRGSEEARIVYDAAASGCVLIHSRTATLEAALRGLEPRWSFEPGNLSSLSSTIMSALAERSRWTEAGLAGIALMQGQTIDEMHRLRAEFFSSILPSAP
jgi:glycosyltransferase involved in cell wall biosynthesis